MCAIQFFDRPILEFLHPHFEGFDAFDGALRVLVQQLLRIKEITAREDFLRGDRHLGLGPAHLFPAPRIRLLKVDLCPQIRSGLQLISLTTDAVPVRRGVDVIIGQESPKISERSGSVHR